MWRPGLGHTGFPFHPSSRIQRPLAANHLSYLQVPAFAGMTETIFETDILTTPPSTVMSTCSKATNASVGVVLALVLGQRSSLLRLRSSFGASAVGAGSALVSPATFSLALFQLLQDLLESPLRVGQELFVVIGSAPPGSWRSSALLARSLSVAISTWADI